MARERNRENLKAARARMYRELVFECAERLFAEEGFEATAIQDVANEAGISLNTLYSAYPGKNEIYADILLKRGQAFVERVGGAIDSGEGVLDKLGAGVQAYTAFLIEHEAYFGVLLREGRSWGIAPKEEQQRERWQAALGLTVPLIQQGMDEGIFYEGDPELFASSVQALMQSVLAGLIVKARKPDPDEISQEVFRQVCRLLCRPEATAARGLRAV